MSLMLANHGFLTSFFIIYMLVGLGIGLYVLIYSLTKRRDDPDELLHVDGNRWQWAAFVAICLFIMCYIWPYFVWDYITHLDEYD